MKNNLLKKNIPIGWSQEFLGDLLLNEKGKLPKYLADNNNDNGLVPYLTIKTIDGGLAKYANINEGVFVSKDDLLVVADGSGSGRIYRGYTGILSSTFSKLTSKNESKIVNDYIEQLLLNINLMKDEFRKGAAIPHLNFDQLKKISVIIPIDLKGQKKIAEILSSVDEDIQKVGKLILKTEELKKGLMTELFTKGIGHKKFKKTEVGITPDMWSIKSLSDLAIITRGGSPRPIESYITDDEDGLNWLRIGDIEEGAKYIYKTSQKIKEEGLSRTTLVNSGDFILSNSMSFGRPYIMKISACIHDGWLAFKNIKTDFISKEFLYYLLSSDGIQSTFKSISAGSGVKNLKKETVSNVLVGLPLLGEQNKIVEVLTSIDNKIEINKNLKEKLTQLKKGLMSDLLSGKVRTINN